MIGSCGPKGFCDTPSWHRQIARKYKRFAWLLDTLFVQYLGHSLDIKSFVSGACDPSLMLLFWSIEAANWQRQVARSSGVFCMGFAASIAPQLGHHCLFQPGVFRPSSIRQAPGRRPPGVRQASARQTNCLSHAFPSRDSVK